MYVAFVEQLPSLHQVHLSLGRWHRCGNHHPVLTPLVPERHRTHFRAAPPLRDLLLVQFETANKQAGGQAGKQAGRQAGRQAGGKIGTFNI